MLGFTKNISGKNENSSSNEMKAILGSLDNSQAVISFTIDGIILDANDNFLNALG